MEDQRKAINRGAVSLFSQAVLNDIEKAIESEYSGQGEVEILHVNKVNGEPFKPNCGPLEDPMEVTLYNVNGKINITLELISVEKMYEYTILSYDIIWFIADEITGEKSSNPNGIAELDGRYAAFNADKFVDKEYGPHLAVHEFGHQMGLKHYWETSYDGRNHKKYGTKNAMDYGNHSTNITNAQILYIFESVILDRIYNNSPTGDFKNSNNLKGMTEFQNEHLIKTDRQKERQFNEKVNSFRR